MLENFHNYKFKIKEMSPMNSFLEYRKIKVLGKKLDGETFLYTTNGGGNYSLYLGNRFFYFTINNENKNINAFDGDLTFSNLKLIKLELPQKIKEAILSIDTQDDLQQGFGGYIQFNTNNIYYDKENKILQIGDINTKEQTFKFFDNAYTQIKQEKLTGIMFTGIDFK